MTVGNSPSAGALRLSGVRRAFGAYAAVAGLDLEIAPGEFIALLGPSGCGKTTALNCIAGLLPLTSGSISLGERRIDQLPPEARGFGMVFQSYALFPHMSARRNIGFGLAMQGTPKDQAEKRIADALAMVRLETQADKLPGQMSGGQQQRVAIARAIVIRPPVVLMDEPLSNLDAKLRLEMRAEIRRIHDAIGSTTIYVTHDQDEALSLADRIVLMREGAIRQVGAPADLYERPDHPDVAEFMGFRTRVAGRVIALDGDYALIESGGARIKAAMRNPLRAGDDALVAIRPEDLVATLNEGLSAKVEAIEYRGRAYFGLARTATGDELYFRSDATFARGCRGPPQRGGGSRRGFFRTLAMSAVEARAETPSLRMRLAARGLDATTALCLPAVIAVVALFIYPLVYGLIESIMPKAGRWYANYVTFFSDPFLYGTIGATLRLALPVTIVNLLLAVPIALRVRLMRRQRPLTTILVLPITLGIGFSSPKAFAERISGRKGGSIAR